MEQTTLLKIKRTLLKEIDLAVWRQFHQTLPEVLNELYIHRFSFQADVTGEDALRVINKSGVLDFCADQSTKDMKDALKRLEQGTFGQCLRCGKELPAGLLEKNPTARFCAHCVQ